MKGITFDIKMYGSLTKMSMRSLMQYRADFWTSLVGVFVLNGANIIQMSIVAWKFDALGTWTAGDLMVLYGLYMMSFGLCSIFFSRITALESEIVSGAFDKYLVRPISPFVQFIGGEIRYVGLCDTLLGALLLISGKAMSGIAWVWTDCIWLAMFIICGGGIIVCIRLILCCASFWLVKSSSLGYMLTQVLLLTQKYPVAIFGDVFKVLVTGIVPVAFMNYYPAVMLLRKADAPAWMCMLSPAILIALIGISAIVWSRGVRRYGSAGG